MLKLIQIEAWKLRRRSFLWFMLLSAWFMPILAVFYFRGRNGIGTDIMKFYKFAAFSYSSWIILPVELGLLSAMLMYVENKNDMQKQLWIIPVNKFLFFMSKFSIVFFYSISFMLLTALFTECMGLLCGYILFDWSSVIYLIKKCLESGALYAFAMLPVLAFSSVQKGYVLPICVTLIYTFLGFCMLMVNSYLHPLSSATAIIIHDMKGVVLMQEYRLVWTIACIVVWMIVSLFYAGMMLKKEK